MTLCIAQERPIAGSLEIIDDIGITPKEWNEIKQVFSVPVNLINGVHQAQTMFSQLLNHGFDPQRDLVIFIGNGGWLVERLFQASEITFPQTTGINISRESTSEIVIDGQPRQVVIMEDVIETGGTACEIRRQLNGAKCPVIMASMIWHDRNDQTETVLDCLSGYDTVVGSLRVRSTEPAPGHDVRSLSTLARKYDLPKNKVYSQGKENEFVAVMRQFLEDHPWVPQLGKTLGYRQDE